MPTKTLKQLYADRKRLAKEAEANRAERKAVNEEIARLEAEDQAAQVLEPAGIESREAVQGS